MPVETNEDRIRQLLAIYSQQRTPQSLVSAHQLAMANDPVNANSAMRRYVGNTQYGQAYSPDGRVTDAPMPFDRLVDTGVLDAISHATRGKTLSPAQMQILKARYDAYGTPMQKNLEDMYQQSPNRWDR